MIERARELIQKGDVEGSWAILKDLLSHEPNNVQYLMCATYVMQQAGNWPMAYHLANATVGMLPDRPEPYLNLSAACDAMYLVEEGLHAAKKALEKSDTEALKGASLMNLASLYINNGRYKEAEPVCLEALKQRPGHLKTRGNLGMAQLARGAWKQGWENYSCCLGTEARRKQDHGLPDWDGTPGKRVLVYGEQGLGDEISFASMVPDLQKVCEVTMRPESRLEGLFARSFGVSMDGEADYQIAVGELGRFFRNSHKDFPRKAYLKADPDRVLMWKALWESKKKPVLGVAWTGGMTHTAAKHRQLSREQLNELVGFEAHWVSLEYKPRPEVPGIHVYPYATLTDDYDDTAALVASLDGVVTMQTAVAHLAGALGVETHVLVPETSQWRYAPKDFLWYGKNFYVHKKGRRTWSQVIAEVHRDL